MGKFYPSCVKSWEDNWEILSTFYAYTAEIRKIIYTTNIIEGLKRQFRRITKNNQPLRMTIQNVVFGVEKDCRTLDLQVSKLELCFNQLNILFADRAAG
jgi:putative transposase